MKEYTVIAEFVDRETGKRLKPGDTITADDDRAERLRAAQVIDQGSDKTGKADVDGLVPLGGGFYQLPDGSKVRGKEKALEALKALQAEGGANDPAGNNAAKQ